MIKINKNDFLFILIFFISSLFLLYKLRYGYFYNDEPFILSLGYRFAKGDLIFTHEWSVGILSGYLTYPFMKLYTIMFNSTDGIFLFGRYCYLIIWSCTILFVYISFRKYKIYNTIACISLYLFAPLDMMTLSYNSFCLMSIIITSTLILNVKNKYLYTLIGFIFSIAVLSIPYMIYIYILFTIIMIFNVFYNKLYLPNNIKIFDGWLFFSLGAFIHVILFGVFILKNNDINGIINGINKIASTNTEHASYGLIGLIIKYFKELNIRFMYYIPSVLVLTIVTFFDKNRYRNKNIYMFISLILITAEFIYLILMKNKYPNLNLMVIPIALLGGEIYLLSENKDKNILLYFIILGIIYSFGFAQASNLGLPAIGTTYAIAMFGSILLLSKTRINNYIIYLILFVHLISQIYVRYDNYYLDENIRELTYKIDYGPAKGIYTNRSDGENYAYQYEQISWLLENTNIHSNLLVVDYNPWFYFISNAQVGAYTTWGSWNDISKLLEMNLDYYKINKEKIPSHIIVKKYNEELFKEAFNESNFTVEFVKEAWDYCLYTCYE